MIDLCRLLGVEEGEEFKFEGYEYTYIIKKQFLYILNEDRYSHLEVNDLINKEIIKLPKKKEFTDNELCIFRLIPKEYEWCARDKSKTLFLYKNKPIKDNSFIGMWIDSNADNSLNLKAFSHLFQSISYKDEEPIYIPDYAVRD